MSDTLEAREIAAATSTLALLNEEADRVRAELLEMRKELADARHLLSSDLSTQIMEANEQLVLAAVHAATIAETAVSNFHELARSSQRDALTNLPNRVLMLDRMNIAIALARRHGTRIAVLFLDLDGFKQINDTYGHAVGDEVLKLVAHRLECAVRGSDTVSRHGGDEFLVLLPEISKSSDAARVATKMLFAIAQPVRLGEIVLSPSGSLGIALYPEDGHDAATLISQADFAMYRCKNGTHGSFAFVRGEIGCETDAIAPADLLQQRAKP